MKRLEKEEWQALAAAHRARLGPFIEAHRARRSRGEKHPVYDFLFEYYGFKASLLLSWSPGIGVLCRDFSGLRGLRESDGGAFLDPRDFSTHRLHGLRETLDILRQTAARAPFFGCNGLHEWAMVHRQSETRHTAPLRLAPEEIAHLVESQPICCSHFDAFRFFTPEARGFNLLDPRSATRSANEQPGCLHANMDLYKWASKFHPFVASELLADAFELAKQAREIDMRAAPYDLRALGFKPIGLETGDGRREYAGLQREIAEKAAPIRERLIQILSDLSNAIT